MVSVKRGGRWVKVSPGQTVGRVSVPKRTTTGQRPKDVYIPIEHIKRDVTTGTVTVESSAPVYKRSSGNNFMRTGTITQGGTRIRPATETERVKDIFTTKQRRQIVEKRFTDAQIRAAGMNPEVYHRQKRKYEQFQRDIKTGKILGVSGIGLSPSEFQKRKLLIRLGVLNESSSMSTLRNVAPLMNEYFIDTKPTATEKRNFVNYLKSNAFSTALVLTPKPQLNAMQNIIARMNTAIRSLTKTNNEANIVRLDSSIKNNRSRLIKLLWMNNLIAQKVGRHSMIAALYFSKTFFGLVGSGLDEIKRQYTIAKVLKKKIKGKDKKE